MYDSHVNNGKFRFYKGILNEMYQGYSEGEEDIDEIAEKIQEDYEEGKLSSSQYDNLMSLVQDIGGII